MNVVSAGLWWRRKVLNAASVSASSAAAIGKLRSRQAQPCPAGIRPAATRMEPPPRRDQPAQAPPTGSGSETKQDAAEQPKLGRARTSFWGLPSVSVKFWCVRREAARSRSPLDRESSASSRGKAAQQKEEQLRAEAEKDQVKPPRFEPVWCGLLCACFTPG